MNGSKIKEKIGKGIFAAAAVICVISVVAIFAFLIIKSVPALQKIGLFKFLFGDVWAPDQEATYNSPTGRYGVLTMIAGTLAATFGALLIGGISGYFTAIFLAFYCPKKLKKPLSSAVNLLAGVPSVVYGFFGIVCLLPALSFIAPNNGTGLLATSIILGVMILPTVVSLSKTALEAVPRSYYEGAVAMGATHSQTVFKVMSPAAKSGITAALVLGIGRALGETMAVVMVAGNAPAYPDGLFSSFRVLTANIVLEMGYAGELQEGALIATGVVLLVFVLIVNLALNFVSRGIKRNGGKFKLRLFKKSADKPVNGTSGETENVKNAAAEEQKIGKKKPRLIFFKDAKNGWNAFLYKIKAPVIGKVLAIISGTISALALFLIVGFIFAKGFPYLIKNPQLIYGKFEQGSEEISILPAIVVTLYSVALSLLIALPVGIMTAIFLNEYTKKTNFFVRAIRTAIDVLSGVPSIVYGLFGMITFVPLFGGSSAANNVLAGVCTVSMMLLPTVVRSTEESLKAVPDSLREGSFGLGAGKLHTIFKVVLPSAMPGILSAVILSMGRVISESAPFLYTMGSVIAPIPKDISKQGGASLAVALYQLSGEGWYMDQAYATAVVLIVIVLALNLAAELCAAKLNKKLGGNANGKK